jgi:hypothetical protein
MSRGGACYARKMVSPVTHLTCDSASFCVVLRTVPTWRFPYKRTLLPAAFAVSTAASSASASATLRR